jgi:predicted RNA binding protein YcfA (HicA-like mRNA interferase family)
MSKIEKLKLKLQRGSGLSCQEVRTLLGSIGFELARQKGSHEQWIRAGKAFTLAAHGKDAPHYILDALRKLIEEDDDKGKEKNKK